jgi:trehalose/maltose hydrolase-like predicted phosphorylase
MTSRSKGGKFCINGVTGPDEYNTVVNNNSYTNLMARENLRYAASTVAYLKAEKPDILHVHMDIGPDATKYTMREGDALVFRPRG